MKRYNEAGMDVLIFHTAYTHYVFKIEKEYFLFYFPISSFIMKTEDYGIYSCQYDDEFYNHRVFL